MDKIPAAPPLAKPVQLHAKGGVENYLTTLYGTLFTMFQRVTTRLNGCLPLDGTEAMKGPLPLMSYATADLPDATLYEGAIVYDSTTNTVKFSDGATWANV